MSGLESFLNLIAPKIIGHFAAGIALALGDRLLSRSRPTSLRMQTVRHLDALKILAYLRDLESGAVQPADPAIRGPESAGLADGAPSAEEIREACEFLRLETGSGNLTLGSREAHPTPPATAAGPRGSMDSSDAMLADARSSAQNVWQRIVTWLRHEKINQYRPLTKLKIGYIIEISADIIQGLAQLVWGRGNFFPALAHSLYQGAALGIGLIVGGFCFRRRDDRVPRRLRKAVERLEEKLTEDPRALALLDRIGRGDLPVVAGALPRPADPMRPTGRTVAADQAPTAQTTHNGAGPHDAS